GNSEGLLTTFHMAFDELSKEEQFKTIDWFAKLGIDRILTHGGSLDTSIEDNLPHLKELIDYAAGRIIILPGGGINADNAERIAESLGIHEVHGTKVVKF
ncbi:MAG: copper homeostasis protein CutC, partial [Enterococcus viikkiensis]